MGITLFARRILKEVEEDQPPHTVELGIDALGIHIPPTRRAFERDVHVEYATVPRYALLLAYM